MKIRLISLLLTLSVCGIAFPKNTFEVTTTSADGKVLLRKQTVKPGTARGAANSIITLDAEQNYPTMDGFGFALTYSA